MIAIGDVVLYMLSDADVKTIKTVREQRGGSQIWNAVVEEQINPAMVVKINPDYSINLKVALDGDDFHWRQYALKTPGGSELQPGYWAERGDWKPLPQ